MNRKAFKFQNSMRGGSKMSHSRGLLLASPVWTGWKPITGCLTTSLATEKKVYSCPTSDTTNELVLPVALVLVMVLGCWHTVHLYGCTYLQWSDELWNCCHSCSSVLGVLRKLKILRSEARRMMLNSWSELTLRENIIVHSSVTGSVSTSTGNT
jgi:hypothetical protein